MSKLKALNVLAYKSERSLATNVAILIIDTLLVIGVCWFLRWLDYTLNWPFVEVMKFIEFKWWYILTYYQWWTWLFIYHFEFWILITALGAFIFAFLVFLVQVFANLD